jgi:hypothetical protein
MSQLRSEAVQVPDVEKLDLRSYDVAEDGRQARERGDATAGLLTPSTVRHRSEVVEYRVDRHYDRLGDQLRWIGFVIRSAKRIRGPKRASPRAAKCP